MNKPEAGDFRLGVIWARFGPYHLARLRGVAAAAPAWRVSGIEVAGVDRDYAWDHTPGADGFDRITVFAEQNYHDLSHRQIAAGVHATLTQLRPHAVAINGWGVPEARAALSWARRHGVRTILMSESKADDRARNWWREVAKRVIVNRFDAALVGGRPHADYLVRLGFPADRIRFGYDAVDNAYFEHASDAARAEAEALRVRLGLPDRYFFACTRFLPRKNIDGLLRAYASYRAQSASPWKLVVAGSGDEEKAFHRLVAELQIGQDVIWPGFIQYPELPVYFGLASAFVHPAKAEAWGLVVNEAAASGLPLLVASPVGAAAELVQDGETGLLFDPHDDGDITRALTEISRLPGPERTAIGLNARRLVANWGPARFGAALADLVTGACPPRALETSA